MKKLRTGTPFGVVFAFILPSFLGFTVFMLIPMISTLLLSFTNFSGSFSNIKWIGFLNYLRFFKSIRFLSSLWVTVKFVFFSVSIQLLLAFFFALLLNKQFRGRNFFRSIIFLPSVLSSVAIAITFMLIFNPEKGPLNAFLLSLGFPAQPWLSSPKTALTTIIMVNVWQYVGYYMVLFLAGLQNINRSLYESADLDGAGPWKKLIHITIPLLSPTTFFCLIMGIIRAFKVFDNIFIMTGGQNGGGPANSTNVLVFDVYLNAFVNLRMGYASALSVILLAIVMIITIIQFQGQKKWVNYDIV